MPLFSRHRRDLEDVEVRPYDFKRPERVSKDQMRALQTLHDGARPKGYEVMKKQGGIVLGLGGDNSPWGGGIWYEGVMTQGHATDATEAQVFGNIVAAGYGK